MCFLMQEFDLVVRFCKDVETRGQAVKYFYIIKFKSFLFLL